MNRLGFVLLGIVFAIAFVFTYTANSYYVVVMGTLALTAIAGIGLNILLGLAGQVSFGHVAFYAIGAYVVAILSTTAKLDFWATLPVAITLSAAVGALLALPAVRVKGPYLAMITIAFGFVVENGIAEWKGVTGGQNGIMGIPTVKAFGVSFGERGVALLAIVLCAVVLLGFWRLSRSAWGSAMRAVKDSEVAAESIGLNPVAIKTLAFALSAACAGLAGALFAPLNGFVTPSSFAFMQSILFVLVVIVGGAGTVSGPLVGAAIVVLLPQVLAGLAEYQLLVFGGLMLLVLWLAPAGIVGTVQKWFRRKSVSSLTSKPVELKSKGLSLSISGLTIAFGGVKAATNVSFEAKAGEVTSLIGPNGAGKTTVLNMLGGFYVPQAGKIALGGKNLEGSAAWRVARSGVARTYQTSQLFGSLSVLENLVIASPERSGTEEEALGLLAFVGYRGDPLARAADLPHVDRRIVEIARALATRPAALLLDEPAAGLSRSDKEALSALLARIAQSGVAVLLVEHDMALVMGVSNHVVVLDAGTPIAEGTPAKVQQDPAVRAAYLGSGHHSPAARETSSIERNSLLEIGGLEAGYGAEPVLKGIDLRVDEGELVAVLGANGAGKSTLMRAIAGLHRPISGEVNFQRKPIKDLPAHRVVASGVVLVPEGRQVFPELSVLDNIRLGAFLRKDATEADVEDMLNRFPRLRERLQQRAGLLSGGEQQMLAVARGLMARPKLLLLDEPSLGLAPQVIEDLFASLDRLRGEKVTLLLVDQMAGLALSLADRAYVIEAGRISASGSASEIARDGALEKAYLGA